MNIATKFSIGDKVECKISGFKGIVIGVSHWITGCTTYGIRPKGKGDSYPESKWFDEPQLKLVKADALKINSDKKKGGPKDAPQSTMGTS